MDITLGIEEELMIIDPATREVIADPPPQIFDRARAKAQPHSVVNELLRAQIETNSKICRSVEELDASLRETRAAVIEAARSEGASVIASSTHPWARWQDQRVTVRAAATRGRKRCSRTACGSSSSEGCTCMRGSQRRTAASRR